MLLNALFIHNTDTNDLPYIRYNIYVDTHIHFLQPGSKRTKAGNKSPVG